jgi:hypothetical protein
VYDYSPSVIQTGNMEQIWWCGQGINPNQASQFSDSIQYQTINLSNGKHSAPIPVLEETPGAWDAVFTCNPKVVEGVFTNPLGNGKNFTYAMYYVALGYTGNNSIGVAFSNDGQSWKKYPKPIITPRNSESYGVGQPAVYNTDQHQAIRMFYEDDYIHHIEAISSDGVHFTVVGELTKNGLDPATQIWGDMSWNPQDGYWYAAYDEDLRNPATTGGVIERGQYSIKLYKIPEDSLLSGATPWQLLKSIDTNLTGYESNFIPSFVRDQYGNIVSGPGIPMLTSISNPPPAWNADSGEAGLAGDTGLWDIGSYTWTPGNPLLPFERYFNQTTYEVTTGWIDPKGGFTKQMTLGQLYESPQNGASVAFYGCKTGSLDYFVSLDHYCEGARILGLDGFGYAAPVAGLNLEAIYRCKTATGHFVSMDAKCEGQTTEALLGYVLP